MTIMLAASTVSAAVDRRITAITSGRRDAPLLRLRRGVLENLVHRIGDVVVGLLGFGLRVDFLDGHPAPGDLALLGVGHVDDERADENVAHLRRRRAHAAAVSPAIRTVSAAVAGAERRDVLLLVERDVI